MFGSIPQAILTSFCWALINILIILMVNMSVQTCPALIRKLLVNMSDVVKNTFRKHWKLMEICALIM